jgi:hypothetical protein
VAGAAATGGAESIEALADAINAATPRMPTVLTLSRLA